jgi:broad specificity phosphatase PhoE
MRRILCLLLVCLSPVCTLAQDRAVLATPGTVLLMRHALAPGTGDPVDFRLGDCTTQRGLNKDGRDQAQRIGKMLRASGVAGIAIYSSQWCRCLETARLLKLGPVREAPAFNSFFAGQGDSAAQSDAALAMIRALPEDTRAIYVTHQVNITALTGIFPRSGEIIVVQPDDSGLRVVGRVLLDP